MINRLKTRARKMRTHQELIDKTPIFLTKQWGLLKLGIDNKVKNNLSKIRIRKIERLALLLSQGNSIKRFIKNFNKKEIESVIKKSKLIKK